MGLDSLAPILGLEVNIGGQLQNDLAEIRHVHLHPLTRLLIIDNEWMELRWRNVAAIFFRASLETQSIVLGVGNSCSSSPAALPRGGGCSANMRSLRDSKF
jgi:hypothetical protein